ncbi:unnamed protein product [Paramecium pentaurelia]|uniref:Uncharacterized protein n=1 Tax=Paramecium pentaurelia TaxID=43138 RepID=A0A8S1T745_9CILI|nr:unnamed protein product [Paramecium pentaurelia]
MYIQFNNKVKSYIHRKEKERLYSQRLSRFLIFRKLSKKEVH